MAIGLYCLLFLDNRAANSIRIERTEVAGFSFEAHEILIVNTKCAFVQLWNDSDLGGDCRTRFHSGKAGRPLARYRDRVNIYLIIWLFS